MAQFDDVTVSGLLTAFQMQGSVVAQGLASQMPKPEAALAIAGGTTNNLVLPGYGNPGIGAWAVGAAAASQIISGVVTGSVVDGQRITLVNNGANSWSTSANGGGSSVGNRFGAAVVVAVGTAQEFINYAGVWYPYGQPVS